MDASLAPRILTAFCLDGSLASITGLLLAAAWLRSLSSEALRQQLLLVALPFFAALLTAACTAHFYLLTADFTGETSVPRCVQQMPSMLSTHAGRVDLAASCAALGLLIASRVPSLRTMSAGTPRFTLTALLFGLVFFFRADSGHAAVDGLLSEALQLLHLGCMAVWSGAILVSGLYVTPRLAQAAESYSSVASEVRATPSSVTRSLHIYMTRLSRTSTFAVLLVFLSGAWKSYRSLGGDLHPLRTVTWGNVLLVKIILVSLALLLGGLNRIRLTRVTVCTPMGMRSTVFTLRWEAFLMLAILALSAALGNVSPPQTP